MRDIAKGVLITKSRQIQANLHAIHFSADITLYHGLNVEARRRFTRGEGGLAFSFRAAYTLSRLVDDGVVNTSSALRPTATDEQRRAFLDSFLVPTRTLRPRTMRVGLRYDF